MSKSSRVHARKRNPWVACVDCGDAVSERCHVYCDVAMEAQMTDRTPRCPDCGEPLKPLLRPKGSKVFGDWYCHRCEAWKEPADGLQDEELHGADGEG